MATRRDDSGCRLLRGGGTALTLNTVAGHSEFCGSENMGVAGSPEEERQCGTVVWAVSGVLNG